MVQETLNELSQLKQSGFGQPWPPRHGLNLLYWFAHDYIDISDCNEIVLRFRPQKGDFGFHKYHNKIDEEDPIVPIVPSQDLPYYEVGNLNFTGADKLPNYVRANYSKNIPDSNKDRIIVRLDANGRLNRVYVTEHSDPKRFDSSKTFRVSQGLLQIIRNMRLDQYLSQLSNIADVRAGFTPQSFHNTPLPPNNDSWCTIL
ncbi:hypothetical protein R3I93_005745 [Phoxinus phoxinus]|uniref:Uncharacterized protein n=1 Tax=Phoxinus phoxinus TaxID=58324 RepID=A0AAN9HDH9_9TELE